MRAAANVFTLVAVVPFVVPFVAPYVAPVAARAEWSLVEEHFYTLALGGHPCGRSSERVERDGDKFRTLSHIEMRFMRLGQETAIDMASEFVETSRGEPVEAVSKQKGAEPVRLVFESRTKARLERGTVRESREIAGGGWLTPRQVGEFVAARDAAHAAEIKFRTIDVQSGFAACDIAMKRVGEEERTVGGRPVKLTRYEVVNSLQPIVAVELYDARGLLVRSTTPIGLGDLVSELATKVAADESYARASFDLIAGTFVATKPIDRYLEREELTLVVEATGGALPALPDDGAQRVVAAADGKSARVTVDVRRGSSEAPGERSDPRWLKPNELIDADNAAVIELLAKAKFRDGATAFQKAEVLRQLVSQHLRAKNLATAFGSASEAAKTRSGDCTEHAVLLAALLRAAGIPSRVASGLVYVPSLGADGAGWGWHLWTQALTEQPVIAGGFGLAWVDFDATVSGGGRGYHPAHILIATSDLAGGASDPAFSRALSLIGAVRISEAAVEHAPSTGSKPAGAAK